jgi:hypothetical protein
MKLIEFLNNLVHYRKKVTYEDPSGKEHYLYDKFVVLDDNGNIDYDRQTELYHENNVKCYEWIKENKPELLTNKK